MRRAEFVLELDTTSGAPVFVRIAEAVTGDIVRGRLRPGDALPGTRTLAQTLGVHRSTVVAAYAELGAQGWTSTRPGGATRVAVSPPLPSFRASTKAPRSVAPDAPGFLVEPSMIPWHEAAAAPPGTLMLWGGVPDLRLVPVELLARAYRRAAKRHGHALLGYMRDCQGHPNLRAAIASLLSSGRGLSASADTVMITRGSQMALDLIARSLVREGDVVAVEALSYASAVNVFRRAGAKIVPIPVDAEGLDVDALVALSKRTRVRLVYVSPQHQYPTTVTLSPTRRLLLLELARRERIAVVEDDYDQEFHYDARPVLPLASRDPGANVIYVGTLAKILAPGLRLGFVVAPKQFLSRMRDERVLVDRQGDAVLECAVAELIEDGDLQRHVRRTRRVYQRRRDALCEFVDRELSSVLEYVRPAGGLALWAKVSPGVGIEAWRKRSAARGVYFQIGTEFSVDGSHVQAVRLGYALVDERTMRAAVRRMAENLPLKHRPAR
jgi:GntR family transcriptional regulator / MocR family aminotransferase